MRVRAEVSVTTHDTDVIPVDTHQLFFIFSLSLSEAYCSLHIIRSYFYFFTLWGKLTAHSEEMFLFFHSLWGKLIVSSYFLFFHSLWEKLSAYGIVRGYFCFLTVCEESLLHIVTLLVSSFFLFTVFEKGFCVAHSEQYVSFWNHTLLCFWRWFKFLN